MSLTPRSSGTPTLSLHLERQLWRVAFDRFQPVEVSRPKFVPFSLDGLQ
jgi:hypothetical protein